MESLSDIFSHPVRKRALIILSALSLLPVLSDFLYEESGISLFLLFVYFMFSILYCFWSVYLIVKIRGVIKVKRSSHVVLEIGAWGYVWRAWLLCFASSITALIALRLLLGIHFDKTILIEAVIYSVLNMVVIPVFCWLFYSNNRKQQLYSGLKYFRGY